MSGIVARSAGVLSLITLAALGATPAVAAPTHQPPVAQTASAQQVRATGGFTASIDFLTLVTREVGTSKCEFRVQGTLVFTGTLDGTASGTTTALINAPCSEASSNRPGTFRDVFRFHGEFVGTVDGVPTTGPLTYAGVTRPGGSIDANIILRGDRATAALRTDDADVGVGGTYYGTAVVRG